MIRLYHGSNVEINQINLSMSRKGKDFGCGFYLNSGSKDTNKEVFDYLYSRKSEIEQEYGTPLVWERLTDKVTCRIKDTMQCLCFDVEDKTPIFEFICKASERMAEIFHNYILDYSLEE